MQRSLIILAILAAPFIVYGSKAELPKEYSVEVMPTLFIISHNGEMPERHAGNAKRSCGRTVLVSSESGILEITSYLYYKIMFYKYFY